MTAQPPLSAAEIAAMRARCEAATPGPWVISYDNDTGPSDEGFWEWYQVGPVQVHTRAPWQWQSPDRRWKADNQSESDADFVSAARTDLPKLLDELERARALLSDIAAPHPTPSSWNRAFRRVSDYLHAVHGQPAEPKTTRKES